MALLIFLNYLQAGKHCFCERAVITKWFKSKLWISETYEKVDCDWVLGGFLFGTEVGIVFLISPRLLKNYILPMLQVWFLTCVVDPSSSTRSTTPLSPRRPLLSFLFLRFWFLNKKYLGAHSVIYFKILSLKVCLILSSPPATATLCISGRYIYSLQDLS